MSIKTPFKDAITPEPSFNVLDTTGTDPCGKPSQQEGSATGSVTPVKLPENTLNFGK